MNNNNNNNCDNNRNFNVEFGTLGQTANMSKEAKASSQAAAQKYKNASKNMNQGAKAQQQFMNEFAQGTGSMAQKGYQAYSQEAKSRTNAAKQAYKGTAQPTEFAQGSGSMSKIAQANSQQAAQKNKKANLNQGNK